MLALHCYYDNGQWLWMLFLFFCFFTKCSPCWSVRMRMSVWITQCIRMNCRL